MALTFSSRSRLEGSECRLELRGKGPPCSEGRTLSAGELARPSASLGVGSVWLQSLVEVVLAARQVRAEALVLRVLLLLLALQLVDLRLEVRLHCQSIADVHPQPLRTRAARLFELRPLISRCVLLLPHEFFELAHLLRVPHLALHEAFHHDPLALLSVGSVLLVPRDIELQQVDVLCDLGEEAGILRV